MEVQTPSPVVSVVDLFARFGGPKGVARIIDKGHSTASEMKRRGSIPVEYWPALIESEQGRDLNLSAEDLMKIHAPSQPEVAA